MHEHPSPKICKHELQYCEKCDTVYCELCKKEWVKKPDTTFRDMQKEFEKWERQRPIKYPDIHSWPLVKKHEEVLCHDGHR